MNLNTLTLIGISGIHLLLAIACWVPLTSIKSQTMNDRETRNEIILQIRKDSGVSIETGRFSASNPILVEKINDLLKESKGEVRKIGSQKGLTNSKESPGFPDFVQVFVSGNTAQILNSLREESWIESAYLKPKSEDPGNF